MANEYDLFDPDMMPGKKVKDWDRMFRVPREQRSILPSPRHSQHCDLVRPFKAVDHTRNNPRWWRPSRWAARGRTDTVPKADRSGRVWI